VPCAVITHAHSDHARSGSSHYIASSPSIPLLRKRLGEDIHVQGLAYGETIERGSTKISLHPAGHILGSAQVRVECHGEVWVVTGDYKRNYDPTCRPFEVVPCDTLITEATFGLPIYKWAPTELVAQEIYDWWMTERDQGRNALLACYALGKAQRILAELSHLTDEPVYVHGATEVLCSIYRDAGIRMVSTLKAGDDKIKGALVLAPPSGFQSPWAKRFGEASFGFASGWMALRGARKNRGYDRGFVISDHADWEGLLQTVAQCGARNILVTHGYVDELAKYLSELGYNAQALRTEYQGEGDA
jgi:putative mRNA 3-end processing factor